MLQDNRTDKRNDDIENDNKDQRGLNDDIPGEKEVLNTVHQRGTTKMPSHRIEREFLRMMDSDDVSEEGMEEYGSRNHEGTVYNPEIFPELLLLFVSKCSILNLVFKYR